MPRQTTSCAGQGMGLCSCTASSGTDGMADRASASPARTVGVNCGMASVRVSQGRPSQRSGVTAVPSAERTAGSSTPSGPRQVTKRMEQASFQCR